MTDRDLVIREETPADIPAISRVTEAAFASLEISRHTEHRIIDALRAANALTLSLVAEIHRETVGHIAFSPVRMSDGTPGWYGLGPVSVLPHYQRQGIGKALVREGLARLKRRHALGCCLVGHPHYYRQFGFENAHGLRYQGFPDEVFFVLPFDSNVPSGLVVFHEAFRTGL